METFIKGQVVQASQILKDSKLSHTKLTVLVSASISTQNGIIPHLEKMYCYSKEDLKADGIIKLLRLRRSKSKDGKIFNWISSDSVKNA